MERASRAELSILELRIILRELYHTTERLSGGIYTLKSIVAALLGLPGSDNDEV